ncbi:hypothetical protein S3E15_02715 [Bacillus mycoides]|uniref:Transposase n=1 Tax=Bacillus mycoides TaxID=1405 RepID=A0A1X6PNY8_BACMY|nr:hypothetical protein S3E15_02715 [Bacillus mycoides]VXC61385.1 conserved hypothetical protein [Bacillus mycoides]
MIDHFHLLQSFCTRTEVKELPKTGSSVGIDMGLKDFAILANGTTYKKPKFFRTLEKN